MATLIEEKVGQLKEVVKDIAPVEIERLNYRLSDAIREGCSVSGQAFNWSDTEGNLCALSAAVVAAKARGYM